MIITVMIIGSTEPGSKYKKQKASEKLAFFIKSL